MNTPTASPDHTSTADPDLVAQALPGRGIPAPDPNPAAAGPMLGTLDVASTAAAVAPAVHPVHLHIEDSGGGGRPLVLIHGWPLSAQSWEPQMPVFQAAGYRVVAYDRRGFGRSDKPATGYHYDTLADDLQRVMELCGLQDVTLVGFSMGAGEVARYVGRWGQELLHSVVMASAVTPYLMRTADNPDGPLTPEQAQQKKDEMERDRSGYFDRFVTNFYSAHGVSHVGGHAEEAEQRRVAAGHRGIVDLTQGAQCAAGRAGQSLLAPERPLVNGQVLGVGGHPGRGLLPLAGQRRRQLGLEADRTGGQARRQRQ